MDDHGISRRGILLGGAAILGAGALAGCTPEGGGGGGAAGGGATAKPRKGGVLRIAASGGGSQDTLDPNLAADDPAIVRVGSLYETLTEINLDYKLENVLAESFESSKGGTVWTVRVRDGVTFHNGKSLTADDILASFQRVFSKESPSTVAATLSWLDMKESAKVDDRTVRFVCTQPVGPFAQMVSGVSIIPTDFDPKTGIGTGPFKLKSFKPGDRSVAERYGDYWRRPAYVDSLECIDFPDPTAGVNALLGGQVDVLSSVPTSQTSVVKGGGAKLLTGNLGRPLTFDMMYDQKPFSDPNVREAFRYIVDRKQLVKQAVGGFGKVGNDMFSPWDPSYRSDLPQRHQDIGRAKSLLKKAGYDGDLKVDLPTTPAVSGLVEMCLVLKQQAKKAGVTINVQKVDPAKFWGQLFGHAPFIPDFYSNLPYLQLSGLSQLPGAPFNATNVNDKKFIGMFDSAMKELDDGKRLAKEKDMQEYQYHQGTYCLPIHADTVDAVSTKVGGYVQNAKVTQPLNNTTHFRDWYLKG